MRGDSVPYKLRILPELDLFILNYSGRVGPADFLGVSEIIETSPEFDAGMDDLVLLSPDADYSEVAFELTRVRAGRFIQRTAALDRPKYGAFVCGGEIQLRMARMFATFAKANTPAHVHVDCFEGLDAAMDWVEANTGRCRERDLIRQVITEMDEAWCLSGTEAA
jgi:hypothetical protein